MELQFRLEQPARHRQPRTRVPLACQRCKHRKQRCDGARPSCSNCNHSIAHCEYVPGAAAKPLARDYEPSQYTKLLEERVAHLESTLAARGQGEWGMDHWGQSQEPDHSDKAIKKNAPLPLQESRPNESIVDSIVHVLRDLSLDASGGYVGPSSTITMGRMMRSIWTAKHESGLPPPYEPLVRLSPMPANGDTQACYAIADNYDADNGLHSPLRKGFASLVSSRTAEKLLDGYLEHFSTKFPVIHTVQLRSIFQRRDTLVAQYEQTVLQLVFAIAGRFLESMGEVGSFFPDRHHAAALENLDEIMRYHDTRTITVLLLLGIYCLRCPEPPGAWTYVGLAMRLCIDIGLHRKGSTTNDFSLQAELKKRAFWTTYCLDRQVSIALGRPFAISDRDIDAELPSDVDEAESDRAIIESVARSSGPSRHAAAKSTTLSSFIHLTRLKVIESSIQQDIYRVDQLGTVGDSHIDHFLAQLEGWKSLIPADSVRQPESPSKFFDGYEYYMAFYHKSVRFLLYPQLSRPDVPLRFVKECAEACGRVCESYKRLHHCSAGVFSPMSLQSVFIAGLTLLYCIWIRPQEIFGVTASNYLSSCNVLLYVIAERWQGAKKYRDAFERIKDTVLDLVAEGGTQSRKTTDELQSVVRSAMEDVHMSGEERGEVANMMNMMVGESWNRKLPVPVASPGAPGVVNLEMMPDVLDPDIYAQFSACGQDDLPAAWWAELENTSLDTFEADDACNTASLRY